MASEMESTSLKQDASVTIGANNTLVQNSNCFTDKKSKVPELNTDSVNLKKDVLKETKGGEPALENKISVDIVSESDGKDGPVMQHDASMLKSAPMAALRKSSRGPEHVKENKSKTGSAIKGKSSFTPIIDIHAEDRIASLLSSCTLEEKNKGHECRSVLPGRLLTVRPKKKLLVLHVNGLLADVASGYHTSCRVVKRIRGKAIFKRPFCDEFLKFCFENFEIGIWSSRRKYNVDSVVDYLLGEFKNKLLFCWDQSKCTDTGVSSLENCFKPLFLKEMKKIWNKEERGLPWKKGEFSPTNSLMFDDSPYKALLNPPHTAIFPKPYHHSDVGDNSLGPGGALRVYLEQLVMVDDVPLYVKEHPFGQSPITASHKDWNFYSEIIKSHSGGH